MSILNHQYIYIIIGKKAKNKNKGSNNTCIDHTSFPRPIKGTLLLKYFFLVILFSGRTILIERLNYTKKNK